MVLCIVEIKDVTLQQTTLTKRYVISHQYYENINDSDMSPDMSSSYCLNFQTRIFFLWLNYNKEILWKRKHVGKTSRPRKLENRDNCPVRKTCVTSSFLY